MTNQPLGAVQSLQHALAQGLEHGRQLEQQGHYQEALVALNGCVAMATRERMTLPVTTFCDLLLAIGFCYADLSQWDRAQRLYQTIEQILKQEGDWQKLIPPGITIVLPPGYDPALPLAVLYDSMAIAHDHANNETQALTYYRQAIDLYMRLDLKQHAAQSWFYMAVGRKQRNQWDKLVFVAEQMLELATQLDDQNGRIKAWQFLAQANANLNQQPQTLNYLKLAVEAEYKLGHPDFERDQAILKDLISMIRR